MHLLAILLISVGLPPLSHAAELPEDSGPPGASFTAKGISMEGVAASGEAWSWGLRLESITWGGSTTALRPVPPVALPNRTEYRRGSIVEWFVRAPAGIEQGFTLAEAPRAATGSGPETALTLDLEILGNLTPIPSKAGNKIKFVTAQRAAVLSYSELHAYDAEGRQLASSMRLAAHPAEAGVERERIRLQIDTTDATYPITIDPLITAMDQLLASDGTSGDQFGFSVAVSGDAAVIGTLRDADLGTDSGSAYIFRSAAGAWSEEAKLVPPDLSVGDRFGYAASISGDVALIATPDGDGNVIDSGAAYFYRFDGSSWSLEQKLGASDGAYLDAFGISVAIEGDVAVIGARTDDNANGIDAGAAYVYRYDGATWNEEQKLIGSDTAPADNFGTGVSISGNVIVIGAYFDDDGAERAGTAFVFRFDGTSWNEEQKLTASDAAAGNEFGLSVAASGDAILVGAWGRSANYFGAPGSEGAAYVFRYDGTAWLQEAKLTASDGAGDDYLGYPVALDGNIALIGARGKNVPFIDSGQAYLFTFDGSSWCETQILPNPLPAESDWFGNWVAVSGDTLMIAARYHDENGGDSGAVFVPIVEGELAVSECPAVGECPAGGDPLDDQMAQCELDLSQCLESGCAPDDQIAQCELDLSECLENEDDEDDEDDDGIDDDHDHCFKTALGNPVDSEGCSWVQFCAQVDLSVPGGNRLCKKCDWKNDEPIMRGFERDCKRQKNGPGRDDDECVPTR